jgi:DNA-binding transcriptional MerR regulator
MAGQSGKLFYKIGEVAALAGVEPYILRYWESEFPGLSPKKNRGGQRTYQPRDLELVFTIKRMLHEEGYTIAGAKKKLAELRKSGQSGQSAQAVKVADGGFGAVELPAANEGDIAGALEKLKGEINGILNFLK